MKEQDIIEQIKKGGPFEGLGDISVIDIQTETLINRLNPRARADVIFQLRFGQRDIRILGEIKTQMIPKLFDDVVNQLSYYKGLVQSNIDICALICPYLSEQNQLYCQRNNIDFIDMSGNILLRIPGTLLIERLGRPNLYKESKSRNPFGGASSRILRVLLNKPYQDWTITGIGDELDRESDRQNIKDMFSISVSSISKTIKTLDDELLIKRDGLKIKIPEPRQMLFRWAEKYRDRYKWLRRSSFKTNNPFGFEVESSIQKLTNRFNDLNIFVSGSAAANLVAPFVDVDRIDVFLLDKPRTDALRSLSNEQSVGPDFQFFYAYDNGVAMYSQIVKNIKIVSDIQIYLDCYERGGRDAKQAEYILNERIEKEWQKPQ